MWFTKYMTVYMEEENGDGGAGGGTGGAGGEDDKKPVGFTKSDVDAAVAAAVKIATDKMTSKNSELLEELKTTRTTLKSFDGIDAEKTKQMFAAFENDQDLKDIAEGRHEDVFRRRTEKLEATHKTSVEALQNSLNEQNDSVTKLRNRVQELSIDNSAVEHFTKQKGIDSAIPDIVLRARSVWKLEGDDIVARDAAGELLTGANGQITMEEWIGGLKKTSAHLFPGSQGAGATGSQHTAAPDFSISEKMKMALESGNMDEYQILRKEQLAKKIKR